MAYTKKTLGKRKVVAEKAPTSAFAQIPPAPRRGKTRQALKEPDLDWVDPDPVAAKRTAQLTKSLENLDARISKIEHSINSLNASLKELPVLDIIPLPEGRSSIDSLFSKEELNDLQQAIDEIEQIRKARNTPTTIARESYNSTRKTSSLERTLDMPLNGWLTEPDGTQKCYKNDVLHADRGPAEIRTNGTQLFYKNGLLHRDDGLPAMVGANGTRKYAVNGKYHRVGGEPAITWSKSNYRHEWWINGEIIRAVRKNGTYEWYAPGSTDRDTASLHRTDGPAVIHPNGLEEYWLNGTHYPSKASWLMALNEAPTVPDLEHGLIDEDPIDEATESKPERVTKTKKEKTMTTAAEKPSFGDMIKADFENAAFRVAGTQMTKAVKTAIVQVMRNKGSDNGHIQALSSFLDTEFGSAIISTALGLGLNYVPHLSEDPRVQRISTELRIEGMAVAGNAVIGEAIAHIMPAITSALAALPPAEASNNVRVEAKQEKTTGIIEQLQEEEMETTETETTEKQSMKL